jgi:hypothetical protein
MVPAKRVGDANDSGDSLRLKSFGDTSIAARMRPGKVTAFAVQRGIQPRIDDYELVGYDGMRGKLHGWQRAAPHGLTIGGGTTRGQGDGAVTLDPQKPSH